MPRSIGFPFIARKDAAILILGTLPGVESLRQRRYYANPQNAFWNIMGELVGASGDFPYEERLQKLIENRIALWDVCKSAVRAGSLDSNILTPKPNDFAAFFKAHKHIGLIAFNGQAAAKMFKRYVTPHMPEKIQAIPHAILPSTSPAHASVRFEHKLAKWRAALGYSRPVT